MRFRFICFPLLIAIPLVTFFHRRIARYVDVTIPSIKWNSPEAVVPKSIAPKLKALAEQMRQDGLRVDNLQIVRSSKTHTSTLHCGLWETRHREGTAVDILVEDWNADGAVTIDDAVSFAHAVDKAESAGRIKRGCCALFASSKHPSVMHLDTGGTSDRWGEIHHSDGAIQWVKWWSREPSLRQRKTTFGLTSSSLNLVVYKRPSMLLFKPGSNSLTSVPVQVPCVVVRSGTKLLEVMPASLGFSPIGDKEKQGDGRTPEGTFRICGKNAKSQFYKSLRLNYPQERHAVRGLQSKLISRAEYNSIRRKLRRGLTPPQNTALGGDIMIHGGGVGENWTFGCIALSNDDIDDLFENTGIGTQVTVLI